MKKTFKRFMAFAMVAVLTASPMSAITADATTVTTDASADASGNSPAEGKAEASGELEGYVDTDIFKVVLPTSAEGVFDFTLDPQELITATSGEAYASGSYFEPNATVFFNNASADATSGDFRSTSQYVQVYNKGTVDCNVSVKAELSNTTGITMASSEAAVSGDTNPNLYLAFTASGDASGDAKGAGNEKALTSTGAELSAVLKAASGDLYEFNVASANATNPADRYSYDLKDEFVSADASVPGIEDYSFALTGACNTEADWSKVTVAPEVVVTWTLTDAESGPQVSMTSAGAITVTGLTSTANFKSATISNPTATVNLTDYATANVNNWSSTDGGTLTFQLKSDIMTAWAGMAVTVEITLTDNSVIQTSVTLN